jgi:cation:H+ antiporter
VNFEEWSLGTLATVFAAAAAAVWYAGSHLARLADAIAGKTGIGRAFIGMILLGGITSLPELAVAVTATVEGNPVLSVNDVLGSAAINIVILAIADTMIGRDALTSKLPNAGVILQGSVGVLVLALAIAPALAGDRLIFGIGIWSWLMLFTYLGSVRMLARAENSPWKPNDRKAAREQSPTDPKARSMRRLVFETVVTGTAILVAGFLLARSGESLAGQTGLGTSFFGVVVLALATSLPELTTVIASVRMRRYTMAISDVFGTNLFNVTIIVLIDALHSGGPVLVESAPFSGFAALLALVLTVIYLVGMLERRDRKVLRMGLDSLAVVLTYVASLVVLYGLR